MEEKLAEALNFVKGWLTAAPNERLSKILNLEYII